MEVPERDDRASYNQETGLEWSGVKWNGVKWSGVEWPNFPCGGKPAPPGRNGNKSPRLYCNQQMSLGVHYGLVSAMRSSEGKDMSVIMVVARHVNHGSYVSWPGLLFPKLKKSAKGPVF